VLTLSRGKLLPVSEIKQLSSLQGGIRTRNLKWYEIEFAVGRNVTMYPAKRFI